MKHESQDAFVVNILVVHSLEKVPEICSPVIVKGWVKGKETKKVKPMVTNVCFYGVFLLKNACFYGWEMELGLEMVKVMVLVVQQLCHLCARVFA